MSNNGKGNRVRGPNGRFVKQTSPNLDESESGSSNSNPVDDLGQSGSGEGGSETQPSYAGIPGSLGPADEPNQGEGQAGTGEAGSPTYEVDFPEAEAAFAPSRPTPDATGLTTTPQRQETDQELIERLGADPAKPVIRGSMNLDLDQVIASMGQSPAPKPRTIELWQLLLVLMIVGIVGYFVLRTLASH